MRVRMHAGLLVASLAATLLSVAGEARAQSPQGPRPSDRRATVPAPGAAPSGERSRVQDGGLPSLGELPLAPLQPGEGRRLSSGYEVRVTHVEVSGSTIFSRKELAEVVAPYRDRTLSQSDLVALRDALTLYYVERGYLTSGAMIPDQDIGSDGVLEVRIVEGRLEQIVVVGNERFRASYFRSRLARAGRTPVNVNRIEEELQRMQLDWRIERVQARLGPGRQRGESVLEVKVDERYPVDVYARAQNYYSPSLGGEGGEFGVDVANLIGMGDSLFGTVSVAEGLRDYFISYDLPLNRFDTTIGGHYRWSESQIVQEGFGALDILSELEGWGVRLGQRLFRNASHDVTASIDFEHRSSLSLIDDEEFCTPDDIVCTPKVSVVRLAASWTWQLPRDVVAAYLMYSIGVDARNSTQRSGSADPDSDFQALFGQAQWAHLFFDGRWQCRFVTRFRLQLAADPLLSMEKIAIGGPYTVRGYPQNAFVRDNGYAGSVELWVPLWKDELGNTLLEVAPFGDFGRAWDEPVRSAYQSSKTPASLGLAANLMPTDWLTAEFSWGYRLKHVQLDGDDVQNDGFHFAIQVTPPWW